MRIEVVDGGTREEFVAYALLHGPEHDDSFANPEDLKGFDPSAERAVVARDGAGRVTGAASLMVRGYAAEGLARFRIFHALDPAAYAPLLGGALIGLPEGIPLIFLFLPEPCPTTDVVLGLGFRETRRASVLRRVADRLPPARPADPPRGVVIRAADPERDASAWAMVANTAFAGDPGRFDVTEDAAREWLRDPRLIPGGSLVATRDGRIAGVAVVMDEGSEEDLLLQGSSGAAVCTLETLAVAPDGQGGGVGRALLRAAVRAGVEAGFPIMELSTGASNDRALRLYRSEGFDVIDVRVCWGRSPAP
jgi:ribosomal protein S18 acetylase RimI-like enzyme